MTTAQNNMLPVSTNNTTGGISTNRPKIIGIYGVSGAGKSTVLSRVRADLKPSEFYLYEGSDKVLESAGVALDDFKTLPDDHKLQHRQSAISQISQECTTGGRTGIVAGHFMFWDDAKTDPQIIWTEADQTTYTHIIYIDVPGKQIKKQTSEESAKIRDAAKIDRLDEWQAQEKSRLRRICKENSISFTVLEGGTEEIATQVLNLIRALVAHPEVSNEAQTTLTISTLLQTPTFAPNEHIFVFDGDRTLAPEDSGKLFWREASPNHDPLKALFQESGYTYSAFQQAALLYQELAEKRPNVSNEICESVASKITIYAPFLDLLNAIKTSESSSAIVVTCGLQIIWERVLQKAGLSGHVKVIGADPTTQMVVTPETKKAIVHQLQSSGKLVTAIGDSPLDIPMLQQADRAVVLVGEKSTRSRTMDKDLPKALTMERLQARQLLIHDHIEPRLDTDRLPLISLSELAQEIDPFEVIIAAHKSPAAVHLLAAPTRNAKVSGPSLRHAHEVAGSYLAIEHLSYVLGLDKHAVPHVQEGKTADKFQFANEEETMIIPLMRGGEPMAFGVSGALPLAAFHHAKEDVELDHRHLEKIKTVILVDWVINTGDSIEKFVNRIHKLNDKIRIVVVAGVVQQDALAEEGVLRKLGKEGRLTLVALRTSENSFKGQGPTDTGDRCFNTTWLKKEEDQA